MKKCQDCYTCLPQEYVDNEIYYCVDCGDIRNHDDKMVELAKSSFTQEQLEVIEWILNKNSENGEYYLTTND